MRGYINNKYINYIVDSFNTQVNDDSLLIKVNDATIVIKNNKWEIMKFKNYGRRTSSDLTKEENWSVLILFLKLLEKGYTLNEIILEKSFRLGHKDGYVDVAIYNGKKPFAFIEVKKIDEYLKYTNIIEHENKVKQLFSYIQQDKNVSVCSYYSFNPDSESDCFSSIFIDENLRESNSIDDLFDKWNKIWEDTSILKWEKFKITYSPLKYVDLKNLDRKIIKVIFNQFLTILRQNSVSDKSNAFDKLINIFLVKVIDERNQKSNFNANGIIIKDSLKFQFIENVDDNISFIKRLNDLYKDGMKEFMDKDIIDYKDEDIEALIKTDNSKLMRIFDDLRLKKNNAFAFIEVFDDKTFEQNALILKEIVCLFQKYKFKYSNKYQYLGDFFEELLNTSWKQEAGQFFTPMPIVDFMVKSLPIDEMIILNIKENKSDFVPKMIDFACGSGHFLISYMDEVQQCLNKLNNIENKNILNKVESYKINPYSWAKDTVVGIEKDYRLAKTTKISGFLNGDGEATIINGDGINKFSSEEYRSTVLYSQKNKLEKFDYVIANPPYSVDGFMKNIIRNNITNYDFSLLENLSKTSSKIEILFMERVWQLLKPNGYCSVVLPQSIFTTKDYIKMREYIFKHFEILALVNLGDITFSGTSTSPTILFLKKKNDIKMNLDYEILIINSPKMLRGSTLEEKKFLGYEFSSNKYKLGIEYINDSLENKYSPILKQWILENKCCLVDKYCSTRKLSEIVIDQEEYLIYPNKSPRPSNNWKTLFELGFTINEKQELENHENLKYIEIGDIQNSCIKIKSNKNLITKKIAIKGDLIISSMTPSKDKVAISDKSYYVSDAIHVIKHNNPNMIKWLFEYLTTDKRIFLDMNKILDGFKITYSKITANNLLNHIYFDYKITEDK